MYALRPVSITLLVCLGLVTSGYHTEAVLLATVNNQSIASKKEVATDNEKLSSRETANEKEEEPAEGGAKEVSGFEPLKRHRITVRYPGQSQAQEIILAPDESVAPSGTPLIVVAPTPPVTVEEFLAQTKLTDKEKDEIVKKHEKAERENQKKRLKAELLNQKMILAYHQADLKAMQQIQSKPKKGIFKLF